MDEQQYPATAHLLEYEQEWNNLKSFIHWFYSLEEAPCGMAFAKDWGPYESSTISEEDALHYAAQYLGIDLDAVAEEERQMIEARHQQMRKR